MPPSPPSDAPDPDAELLLDRLLSSTNPSDCLDSLDRLRRSCVAPKRKGGATATGGANNDGASEGGEEREGEEERRARASARAAADAVLASPPALRALCSLVASSTLPSPSRDDGPGRSGSGGGGAEVEGGDAAACDLLLALLPAPPSGADAPPKSAGGSTTTEALRRQREERRRTESVAKVLLRFHESIDGGTSLGGDALALTPSLLDRLCAPSPSAYARVLSLQLLRALLAASPGAMREQLAAAPDGINRLVDLLGHGSAPEGGAGDEEVPEEVRNEALLFLTSLASSSSVLARLVTFSEGYDRALKIALEAMGAGGGGLSVAKDCLDLCLALARADDVARELFLGGGDGKGNLDRLARLVDLRSGERYRDKERNLFWEKMLRERRMAERAKKKTERGEAEAKREVEREEETTSKPARKGGKKRGKKAREDDDLDDILRGASAPSSAVVAKPSASKTEVVVDASEQRSAPASVPEGPPVPYLTPDESRVALSVLDLLLVLLRDGASGDVDSPSAASRVLLSDASRSKRRSRAASLASHELSRYVADCALYTLPPTGVDYVSAVPPPKLQRKALAVLGTLGSLGDTEVPDEGYRKDGAGKDAGDSDKVEQSEKRRKKDREEEDRVQTWLLFETMPVYLRGRVAAIDRLMYLCCTGAYVPRASDDDDAQVGEEGGGLDDFGESERPEVAASLLSASSVAAFQSCLPPEAAGRMVLHALAPPPPEEADEAGAPREPPVVARLTTTLADNLRFLRNHWGGGSSVAAAADLTDLRRAVVGATGAAGALGVFLARGEGDAVREMMLRLPPPPPAEGTSADGGEDAALESSNLIDFVLQHVAAYNPDPARCGNRSAEAYVAATLLRLLCEWVAGSSRAVAAVLASPSSVSVGALVRLKGGSGAKGEEAVSALSGLLLGLCLEHGADDAGHDAEDAAWTKDSIAQLISLISAGRYLSVLDALKRRPLPLPYCPGMERSVAEQRYFAAWYGRCVASVRRRVVAALAGGAGGEDSDSDGDEDGSQEKKSLSTRSLRKMVSRQAREVDDLQDKLDEALLTVTTQSAQIRELERIAELGASAEANDAVAQYVEKVADLERAKSELRRESEALKKVQEEALAAKDEEVAVAREEVRAARAATDALSEELAGLSAAYNSLEDQYHRSNGNGSGNGGGGSNSSATPIETTAGGEAAAEDGGGGSPLDFSSSPSVPGGETAAEDPGRDVVSAQVQSLREENARLREDVRAANEWMSMAVGRMEEMGAEREALSLSLEEAQRAAASTSSGMAAGSNLGDVDASSSVGALEALREEVRAAREEAETAMAGAAEEAKAREEELTEQRARVQKLEGEVEEAKLSSASLASAEELESLRRANKEAQDWMANAVTHVDTLTKQVQEKDEQLGLMEGKLRTASEDSELATNIAELERSLEGITSERNALQVSLSKAKEEMDAFQDANDSLRKAAEGPQDQESPAKESLRVELDHVKAENATLASNLSEFQSWSDTAQGRMAEVEAELSAAVAERDNLKSQLEDRTSSGDENTPSLDSQKIESLVQEIREKDTQLERMQNQLIEDADERDAEIEKLREGLEAERQRSDDLAQQNKELAVRIDELILDNQRLSGSLAEKQAVVEEANRRISELEAAKAAAETQADKLMGFEDPGRDDLNDQIMALTAERNNLQTQLEDVVEEYEETRKSLELANMDKGNLTARNRALEQDNKSLEFQHTETQSKLKDMDELLAAANGDKSTLKDCLDEMKKTSEETVELWQERVRSMEDEVRSLGKQLEQQENDSAEAIAQWEQRCLTLEESGGDVIQQWEERVKSLEVEVSSLEGQLSGKENKAMEAMQQWEQRVQSLETDVASLETQLTDKDSDAAEAIAQWEERCSALEQSGGDVVRQWQERVESLEADVALLENQLAEKENEAMEAIAQWEERCSALEESGANVQQWEQRVESLQGDIASMENQLEQQGREAADAIAQWEGVAKSLEGRLEEKEKEAADAIAQWESRCLDVESSLSTAKAEIDMITKEKESIAANVETLNNENKANAEAISRLELQLASSDEQVSELAQELEESQNQSEQVVKQWQERSEQLEVNIEDLENTLQEQENGANDAIAQWEARCACLDKKIEGLEQQLALYEKDTTVEKLKEELSRLSAELKESKSNVIKAEDHLKETKDSLALRASEWDEKEATLTSTIDELKSSCSEHQKKYEECKSSLNILESETIQLQKKKKDALKETEESQVVVLELKEELRQAQEELQSFATDKFSVKATDMATQALRQQMVEIRSQYAVEHEVLTSEKEARRAAEEEVQRLRSDLAFLAQATEYDENVDAYVRKMAKKVSSENVKTERKEMEDLRSTLERLREELGSCRWKEKESVEKAANACLQMSILEQEVSAAKADMALLEQAMDELENSKIELSVALEYRIEAMENERILTGQSCEEEINGIKAELAQANQERDNLVHKLEQSEKANAALVFSTSHDGSGREGSESEVIKLQLERAQLLARINDMGADLERRVRESVAAQASSFEAELIVEKQSRKSVETSLADALSELEEVKTQMADQAAKNLAGEIADKDRYLEDLEESLGDMRVSNNDLESQNKVLQAKLDAADKENKSAIQDLTEKLQKAEERLRSNERESRFEAAIASEIANLRTSTRSHCSSPSITNGNQRHSQALVLRGIDQNTQPPSTFFGEGKDSVECNSSYIIEMYDYVVELKQAVTEERRMYKDLLAEHEDLLALLGQANLDGL